MNKGECKREMGKKRALMIASVASMLDNFNRSNIDILLSMGYKVTLAANFDTEEDINSKEEIDSFAREMREKGCRVVQIGFTRKTSRIGQHCKAYRRLRRLAGKGFDLVHCHSPICSALTRLAFKKERKKGTKVIYTAHGFHFFKGAPLKNWLLYFPVEWLCARWTDVLITINKEDYRLARRFMRAGRVEYIPGVGIDMERIAGIPADWGEVRRGLGISEDDYMLLSVGELSKRKNASIVVRALSRLADESVHYFVCGIGPEEESIKALIKSCHLESQVHLLGFRSDIAELLRAADLFVFPSLQEGLPVALMEAVASKTPVICSGIRGNTDLIPEKELLFDPKDEDSVLNSLREAMGMDMSTITERHYEALKKYDLKNVSKKVQSIYKKMAASNSGDRGGYCHVIQKQAILSELGVEEPSCILLSVGEPSERKNQETVIRALARLHRTDIVYLIVGEGSLMGKLQSLVRECGLQRQVFFLGYRTDVGSLCELADIFVHISLREGLGMAPLEAMAKGLPLLSSYVNGMRDYTLDGVTGCCIQNPTDAGEVASAISRMIVRADEWEDFGEVNRAVARRFSIEKSRQRMEAIYGMSDSRRAISKAK